MGQPQTTEEMIDGKPYIVSIKDYVLFPQKSGPLTIPSQTFVLQLLDPNKRNRDPFASFGFRNSMFQPTKNLRLTTDAHKLNVLAIPSKYKGPWIPATQLELSQSFSSDNQRSTYETGDIIQRKITINAANLLGNQLPNLSGQFTAKGLSAYPKTADFSSYDDQGTVVGQRIENIEYVANNPGNYTFPEVHIQWWNTATNKLEKATLPAKTITITGAALPQAQSLSNANLSEPKALPQNTPKITPVPFYKQESFYYLLIGLAILCLLLILLWFILRHKKTQSLNQPQPKKEKVPPLNPLLKNLKHELKVNNHQTIRQCLSEISDVLYPQKSASSSHTANSYQKLIDNLPEEVAHYLEQINANAYAETALQQPDILKNKTIIALTIASIRKLATTKNQSKQPTIPELYPRN